MTTPPTTTTTTIVPLKGVGTLHIEPHTESIETTGFNESYLFVVHSLTTRRTHGLSSFLVAQHSLYKCTLASRLDTIPGVERVHVSLGPRWPNEATWRFPLRSYVALATTLVAHVAGSHWRVDTIPIFILRAILKAFPCDAPTPEQMRLGCRADVYDSLFEYQRRTVEYVIRQNGRSLIADAMGLGKTRSAIAALNYLLWALRNDAAFRALGKVIVVAPKSVTRNWCIQFEIHGAHWSRDDIQLVDKKSTIMTGRVIVMTYQLALMRIDELKTYGLTSLIVDEAHYCKNVMAQRTKALTRISIFTRFVLLLTGTPINCAAEIFALVQMIDRSLIPFFFPFRITPRLQHQTADELWTLAHADEPARMSFAARYCDPKLTHIGRGRYTFTHKGCVRSHELHALLQRRIMIRHLKDEVGLSLPEKVREQFYVGALEGRERDEFASRIDEISAIRFERGTLASNPMFMELWRRTRDLKIEPLVEYITNEIVPLLNGEDAADGEEDESKTADGATVEEDGDVVAPPPPPVKVLLFAYHHVVLNAVEKTLAAHGIPFIRIDGNVSAEERKERENDFQTNPMIRAAVLQLTATACGITLTASTRTLMCELYWTPDVMLQAEDRNHRIGQTQPVLIQYLMIRGSTDEMIFSLIQSKARSSGSVLDNRPNYLKVEKASVAE